MGPQVGLACPPSGTRRRRSEGPPRRGSRVGSSRAPRRATARSRRPEALSLARRYDVGELDVDEHQRSRPGGSGSGSAAGPRSDRSRPPPSGRRGSGEAPRATRKGSDRGRAEAARGGPPREPGDRPGAKERAGAGGVVMGAEEQARRRVGPGACGRRRSARRGERTAGAAGRSGRSGRGTSTSAATRTIAKPAGALTIATRLPAKPEQAVGRLGERTPGDGRRSARPPRVGRPRAAARPASCRLAARRRFRPAGPRTSTARGSLAGGRRCPRAGHYRRGRGEAMVDRRRRSGPELVDTRP